MLQKILVLWLERRGITVPLILYLNFNSLYIIKDNVLLLNSSIIYSETCLFQTPWEKINYSVVIKGVSSFQKLNPLLYILYKSECI